MEIYIMLFIGGILMKKKSLLILMSVITLSSFLFIGCGDNMTTIDNTKQNEVKKTNLTKEVNKLSVYIESNQYFTTDNENISLIKELLSDVEYIEDFQPEKEGGYEIELYNENDLVYQIVIMSNEVIIEDEYFYKKEISLEKYEEIKDMLIGLNNK